MGAVIGIIGGMVSIACIIGIHTAKQQLLYSPSVQVTKKRRECIPEVDSPDAVMRSADKFMSKSFLRKVGHIQDRHEHTMNEQARYGSTRRYACMHPSVYQNYRKTQILCVGGWVGYLLTVGYFLFDARNVAAPRNLKP
ncbi:hypothetical protein PHJA_001316400 [Phtheirospermum japonicum]|uniref:Uncharacterized protein n=1 Tax=Phtheirospermum japonicum TaxID=374723 RepID=A0A830C626_9LAMI|nr:hypothetical protein PHJA_001316400 [Phtheirospermum japonicum]